MDRYAVTVLCEDVATKRQRFDMLGAMNTFGLEPAERLKLDVDYRIAREEWLAAELALAGYLTSAKSEHS